MQIEKLGKIKVETELVDISYLRTQVGGTKVVIVEFMLKRPVSPEEAKDVADLLSTFVAEFIKPKDDEVVAVSGRGPIYLYMMLQHNLQHTVAALGTFDPKVRGVVLTAVHSYTLASSKGLREGQVIKLPDDVVAKLTQ